MGRLTRWTNSGFDNIGTGEGAQAYGWGLYFAAAGAIAEYYQKRLLTTPFISMASRY